MANPIAAGQARVSLRVPNPSISRNQDRDLSDIFFSFFKEQVQDIAKGVGYATFWIVKALHPIPYQYREFGNLMRDVKNFIGLTEIPDKLDKVVRSAKEFFEDPSIPTGCTAVKENMGLANSLFDTLELVGTRKVLRIGKDALGYLGAANYGATLVGSGISAYENVDKIDQAAPKEAEKVGLYLIRLARDVSYVVLGAFGVICFFAGLAAAPFYPVVMAACLTSALTFSIGGYFYERIVNPEENPNYFDPKKLLVSIQNRNQRIIDLVQEKRVLEASIQNLNQRIRDAERENGLLEHRNQRIRDLEQERLVLENSVQNLNQRIRDLEQEKHVLENTLVHRRQTIMNLTQRNVDLQQRLAQQGNP